MNFKKYLLVMKLTSLLMIVTLMQVSAASFSQVTLHYHNAPITTVLQSIKDQTGYYIFYQDNSVKTEKISISVSDIPLRQALDSCFKNQFIRYKIVGKTIALSKIPAKAPLADPQTQIEIPPQHDVRIHVTDSTGQPLSGAGVTVKGTKQGGSTDAEGNLILSGLQGRETLIISYIGYETKEINIDNRENIVVVLKISTNPLDEMQVIAYGKTTKRFQTGDVSTVSAEDIARQPVTNPVLALQGKVPGLVVTQSSGYPGSPVNFKIQGQIRLSGNAVPLVVIDGIPYDYNAPGWSLQNTVTPPSGLNFINNDDIESISVLKDADATSIYGSRAAAGAILITTKKGKAGKTKYDINVQNGWSKQPRGVKLMNTQQYLQMRREAFASSGLTPGPTDYDVNGVWDTTRYTDWQKYFFGGTAQYTDAQVSISGGSANTQFRIAGGYNRQTLVVPGDHAVQSGSISSNLTNTSANGRLSSTLNIQYLVKNQNLPTGGFEGYITMAPDAPALLNKDGSINWARIPSANGTDSLSTFGNPLATNFNVTTSNTNNFVGNLTESYRLLPGLFLKAIFGYNYRYTRETNINPLNAIRPEWRPQRLRTSRFMSGDVYTWQAEPQINYQRRIWSGNLDVLAGATFNNSKSFQQEVDGSGYATDNAMYDIGAATTVTANTVAAAQYRYNAFYGKLNYNFNNKYIFDGAFRRDGSSRFGADNLFHDFWSVAGAWIFSEEKAVKETLPFLSFGKIRASYGTTGNDQIGDYQYLESYNFGDNSYQHSSSLSIGGLPNPFLQWEETRKLSASVDLGFLDGRILLNATYYRNRSSNQLLYYPLPSFTGFTGQQVNLPATIQNWGGEFVLTTENIKSKQFQWTSSLNLTTAKNKLVSFPGLEGTPLASRYVIGQPITVQHVFRFAGVDPETGVYQFYTHDGGLTSNPVNNGNTGSDQTKLMDLTPSFYGGFENTISFKGFSLDFLFRFAKQKGNTSDLYNNIPGAFYSYNGGDNQPVELLNNWWLKPGDHARFQRPFLGAGTVPGLVPAYYAYNNSDVVIVDASYIRLQNVSLSYNIPEKWVKKMKVEGLRIYAQAQNLLTITKFPEPYPEVSSLHVLPPLRTITFGAQFTF